MKLNRNSALFTLMLFMGAIWCYDVYIQQSNSNYLSGISAENDSSFEVQDCDVEISEEDQIFHKYVFSSTIEMYRDDNHFYISNRSILPFYSVWHPPKLS